MVKSPMLSTKPLPGATILIEDLHTGVTSDINGFYALPNLKPGTYKVKVSYVGYEPKTFTVRFNGKTIEHDVELNSGSELNEVVVNGAFYGQRKALQMQKEAMGISNVVSADQVGKFPDSNIGDALKRINQLPTEVLPQDGGVGAGEKINSIDLIANTGDIANRMEKGVQCASDSWNQYANDWKNLLHVEDASGNATPIYLLAGNHDVTNAIGFHRPMNPKTDATSLASIYNLMMKPAKKATATDYDYTTQKVRYSFTRDGLYFMFVGIWPDTETRNWMEEDIKSLPVGMPILVFAHDPATGIMKHFYNPNGNHDINAVDKFENLLVDMPVEKSVTEKPLAERSQWIDFVKAHPGIKAYFHGHTNYSEFYSLQDENGTDVLPVFRVDSPMKGEISSKDEGKLSFMVICIDTDKALLTAREYLWNNPTAKWGASKTISIC